MGLYELMSVDDEIRELILAKGSEEDLRNAAIANGMTSLRDDGLTKVKQGLTSVAEVLRVIGTAS
jgi:type IV pilus assembly protein PilB